MDARDARSIERLDHVASELGATTSRIRVYLEDPPPMFEQYVVKLQSSVKRLRELEYQQRLVTPREAAEGKRTAYLRQRLRREYMIPLTRTGKPLLDFAPGIEKALKVPHARASHRELVTTAEVMLKAVQPYRKLLLSEGFPKAFFTELRDLTKELKRIATTSSQRQATFARVTRDLREELATANETLRILDGFVLARADRDPGFAKAWKDAMRSPKPLGRPRAKKRRVVPNSSREEPLTA